MKDPPYFVPTRVVQAEEVARATQALARRPLSRLEVPALYFVPPHALDSSDVTREDPSAMKKMPAIGRDVVLQCSDECAQGLGQALSGARESDKTVTRARIAHAGPTSVIAGPELTQPAYMTVIFWETVSAGFGELMLVTNQATGETMIDSEHMSPEFVKAVLSKLVDQAIESKTYV